VTCRVCAAVVRAPIVELPVCLQRNHSPRSRSAKMGLLGATAHLQKCVLSRQNTLAALAALDAFGAVTRQYHPTDAEPVLFW
jgi:hypothetical protein